MAGSGSLTWFSKATESQPQARISSCKFFSNEDNQDVLTSDWNIVNATMRVRLIQSNIESPSITQIRQIHHCNQSIPSAWAHKEAIYFLPPSSQNHKIKRPELLRARDNRKRRAHANQLAIHFRITKRLYQGFSRSSILAEKRLEE